MSAVKVGGLSLESESKDTDLCGSFVGGGGIDTGVSPEGLAAEEEVRGSVLDKKGEKLVKQSVHEAWALAAMRRNNLGRRGECKNGRAVPRPQARAWLPLISTGTMASLLTLGL